MKIGLIADVHANRPALKEVLKAMENVEAILCAGDITGYYTDPNGVIADLLAFNVRFIKGNHDFYLEKPPQNANRILSGSIEFTQAQLLPDYGRILAEASSRMELELDGLRFLICHGSPWDSLEEYIYPDYTDFNRFEEIDADIIVLGHTHYPMIREVKGRVVINPGSCGQPRDGNPHASFAVIDTRDKSINLKRVDYDSTQLIESLSRFGLNSKLARYLPIDSSL